MNIILHAAKCTFDLLCALNLSETVLRSRRAPDRCHDAHVCSRAAWSAVVQVPAEARIQRALDTTWVCALLQAEAACRGTHSDVRVAANTADEVVDPGRAVAARRRDEAPAALLMLGGSGADSGNRG
jgi:hypothetical protein